MRLATFAHYVTAIMADTTGFNVRLDDGTSVTFRLDDKAGCYMNGQWCGNRHGVVQEFTRLVEASRPVIQFDVDEEIARQVRIAKSRA